LATPGKLFECFFEDATLKGLRHRPPNRNPVATPSELGRNKCVPFLPGFQSKPWAKISERFQRYFLELANAFSVGLNSDRVVDRKTS
jgi:hypothetical protein